jgi:hypothetical protein
VAPFFGQAGSVNWQTPPEILALVERANGGKVDLDPCAGATTQIGTKNYRPVSHDGLKEPWEGTVFVNCPFGTSFVDEAGRVIGLQQFQALAKHQSRAELAKIWRRQTMLDFALKAAAESRKWARSIFWLSKSATETRALQHLFGRATGVCHPATRVNYVDAETGKAQKGATFPSIIIHIGEEGTAAFREVFANYGAVL